MEIQNDDGSFEVKFLYASQVEKGWLSWGNTAYDTATVMLALLSCKAEKAKNIVAKGQKFILAQSLDHLVWKFSSSQNYDPMPYDSDATAICSYVLNQLGVQINNKSLLNAFIDNENNYKTWIVPKQPTKVIPITTFLKIYQNNAKALLFNKLNISLNDREFAMNCNILLHTGVMEANKLVWQKLVNDFKNFNIECRYYDVFYGVYAYARLYALEKHKDLFISTKLIEHHFDKLMDTLDLNQFSLRPLFLANAILFFQLKSEKYQTLMKHCLSFIEEEVYKTPAPYYSSNLIHDKNEATNTPVNYFGSSALNTSLCLEFLNLYSK